MAGYSRDWTDINPNQSKGLAKVLRDTVDYGLESDWTINYGYKLKLEDVGGDYIEIYASGSSLVIPATASSTRLDDVDFYFGTGSDVNMVFNGTKFSILCPVADDTEIEWGDGTESFDHEFFFASASDTVYFDASLSKVTFNGVDLYMLDADMLIFGDGSDLTMRWDGTDFDILAVADDTVIKFGNGTLSWDIWIYGNTANDNVIFNASDNIINLDGVDLMLEDDDILKFGDSSDVTVAWAAGGGLDILAAADNTEIRFGATGNSFDVIWYGSTSAAYFKIDTSENEMVAEGVDIRINDTDLLNFGDAKDIEFQWTNAKFTMTALADDKVWEVGDGTQSIDLKWFGGTATEYVYIDVSADVMYFEGVDLRINDDDNLILGDSDDVTLYWANGGGLKMGPAADDTVWEIGTNAATQLSFDVKIYGGAANGADYFLFDAGASVLSWAGAASLSLSTYTHAKITNKTGDYTVTAADTGTIFTTVGTSADVEFTLPTEAAGLVYEFYMCEEFELKVTSATANNIIGYNDKADTSITFTTATEQIGSWVKMVCNGTVWLCTYSGGTTGNEYTGTFA